MNNEHERYNLNPQQFAEYKKKAEERGGSVRVPGTDMYIPASKASKQKRHQETRDFHESLVPMKKTLNEAGSSRNAIIWARELHSKNPQEFMQQVGLKSN